MRVSHAIAGVNAYPIRVRRFILLAGYMLMMAVVRAFMMLMVAMLRPMNRTLNELQPVMMSMFGRKPMQTMPQ
jgi:hypothetical protein